jgi:putative membrane protein
VHEHGHVAGAGPWEIVVATALVAAAAAYAVALARTRGRSPWPPYRPVLWYLGLACVAAATLGPLAAAGRQSFTAHMAGHVLLGMLGPLLLVLAAPVTLLLRALPVARARTVSRVLRARWARVVAHPAVAGRRDAGGRWRLYATDLFHAMHASPLVGALVHAHVLLAGCLLTASLVGPDPSPHRASLRVRAVVLVAFVAAHSVLAKWLSAHPPHGVGAADALAGAQLMYYAGDVVDVALMVLLLAQWYAAARPREAGPQVPSSPASNTSR